MTDNVCQIQNRPQKFTLSWSHYLVLMRIENPDERHFYEIECQKQDFEKPTVGILLCKEKNDALVELTLPKDANIHAAAYQLYLPDKALLQAKVREWIKEFEENEEIKKLEED